MHCVEYKVPGGKMLRLRTVNEYPWRCTCDGDFFIDQASLNITAAIEHTLSDLLNCHIGNHIDWKLRYAQAFEQLQPLVDGSIIGISTQALAYAYVRLSLLEEDANEHTLAQCEALYAPVPSKSQSLLDPHSIEQRWQSLDLQVILDIARMPQEQMHIEEVWSQQVAEETRGATLRFWQWAAPAIVVGKYQCIEDEVNVELAQREGVQIVRRDTGGGAMFIEPKNTITYSLYVPQTFCAGLSVEQTFQLCDSWVIAALRAININAHFAGLNDIASDHGKIAGSAERKFSHPKTSGALLHHTTMAYDIDADRMSRILKTSPVKLSDKAVQSAKKRVDPLRAQTNFTRDEIVYHLAQYAQQYASTMRVQYN